MFSQHLVDMTDSQGDVKNIATNFFLTIYSKHFIAYTFSKGYDSICHADLILNIFNLNNCNSNIFKMFCEICRIWPYNILHACFKNISNIFMLKYKILL